MPRNFYRRVEVMFPVEAQALRKRVLQEIIPAYAADNVKARELISDGSYRKIIPQKDQPPIRAQHVLLDFTGNEHLDRGESTTAPRKPRRKAKEAKK